MAERPIDTYSWGSCRFEWGLLFLRKVAVFELRAQAMPHTEGWENLSGDGPPPIEFIRSMFGAQFLDGLNALLVEEGATDDR